MNAKIIIEIECVNAAFGETDADAANEVRRILSEQIASSSHVTIRNWRNALAGADTKLLDYNGNHVGTFRLIRA